MSKCNEQPANRGDSEGKSVNIHEKPTESELV